MLDKFIYDITPFSVVDYPDELAAIVWFAKCNMRCVYCYNKDIVLGEGKFDMRYLSEFLNSRQNLLSAVVLSGGECTKSLHFSDVLKLAKNLGYKTKVDTNGSSPEIIEENLSLVDFISLDFKAPKAKFEAITASNLYDKFIKTLQTLLKNRVEFECRTTIHADMLNENDISDMVKVLSQNGYDKTYYLQNFFESLNLGNLQKPKTKFDPKLIKSNLNIELRNF
ncbi:MULTISPECIES: anaerobic ribonucleoside-triphosphate reductase activating protein [Campylobacter]|uniref:anaerobic ribonucleoside-triphosphate reductase activating protein n=1 Tax=Campylobacter TaxID=194 RepID=UPI00138E40F8|nr:MULTISPECIES: anaerobic ribonucleoside-triphosphate reductase activating protein [Campylobacter]MDV2489885.1 anaerobic ribonucleoside-triphosphate reductase activating protein [Campylobacter sp. TJR-1]